jgi:hypothetical protein
MRELLELSCAHGFKTYVVSGGGAEFIRPWIEQTYGIPPEQVIGSRIREQHEVREGQPVIVRLPEIEFINDKAGKPIGIHQAYRPAPHPGGWRIPTVISKCWSGPPRSWSASRADRLA